MSSKVLLPKGVGEAIQTKFDHYSREGMAYVMWECTSSDTVISRGIDLDNENIIKLSQFLMSRFEVIKTPEGKVRELYQFRSKEADEATGIDESYYNGICRGINECLEALNIKIEGVNAE